MLITSSKTKVMFKNLLTKETRMKTSSSKMSLRREEVRRKRIEKEKEDKINLRRWILIT
jgi:hypothetical protein